jgi:hypothetical protein
VCRHARAALSIRHHPRILYVREHVSPLLLLLSMLMLREMQIPVHVHWQDFG